jgi:hypothetical protein
MTYVVNGFPVADASIFPVFWVQPEGQDDTAGAPAIAALLALFGALAMVVHTRARLRVAATRPLRPLPIFAQRAPTLAALLFLGAIAALLVGALINSGASG